MAKRRNNSRQREIPEEFFERLNKITSNQSEFQLLKSTFQERPTTLRINTLKADSRTTTAKLKSQGFKLQQVPWASTAFILLNKSKKDLTKTDQYKNGEIYLQSLASQLPSIILEPEAGEIVLDLTAAPGSKTSQIAALMKQKGQLTAIEINEPRFHKLVHNLEHLGVDLGFVHSENTDGSYFAKQNPAKFDKILLDAPCSAEARFCINNPKSFSYWSTKTIKEMKSKQWRLLKAAWVALKPGGTLVYSTCTLAPEENEVQIHKMLNEFPDCQIMLISLDGLSKMNSVLRWNDEKLSPEVSKTLRIRPTKLIESFFVAKLKKIK